MRLEIKCMKKNNAFLLKEITNAIFVLKNIYSLVPKQRKKLIQMKAENGVMGCNMGIMSTYNKQRQKEMMFVCHPMSYPPT